MHPFNYVAARTLDEAVAALAKHGPRAKALAGGTDVLVQLRGERFEIDAIVDVKGIPETTTLSLNGGLSVGAAVPCYQVYEDEAVSAAFPGIIDAASLIGGIQIQSRASLGGNLCNAAPSADGIPPLIVLESTCVIAGPNGTREMPVEDFCTAPGRNAMQDNEFLVSLRIPSPKQRQGANYLRFIPRNEMDIAVAGVGSSVVLSADKNSIESARISLASVAPTPLFVKEAGDALAGKAITEEAIEAAAQAAMAAAKPITDMRGTIRQRRHLVGVLTRRTLQGAIERAKEA